MSSEHVRLLVSFKINEYETFKKVAELCAEYVLNNEPGALVYDWYVDSDKSAGRLFEVYESPDVLKEHIIGPVFMEMGPQFGDSITWLSIEAFGQLPDEFHQILGAIPTVSWPDPLVHIKNKIGCVTNPIFRLGRFCH